MNPHMLPKVRSAKIMKAARGMPCTVRVSSFFPGHKCSGTDTTVMAHLPVSGKGTSTKVSDLAVAASCFHCHAIIDGVDRQRREYIEQNYPSAYAARLLQGHHETMTHLWMQGVILIPDGEEV